MKRVIMLVGAILLFSLLISACSSSASIPNTGSNALNVSMSDYKYDPPSWTVAAGSNVTVNLKNVGTTPHTWVVMSKPISGSYTQSDQSDILFTSGAISPGSSKTVTFTAPSSSGNYQVICTEPGHFVAGMVGQLTVK